MSASLRLIAPLDAANVWLCVAFVLEAVGATVGQRGARVQAVVAELSGEKIDVIPWNDDPAVFVANALSPAQVLSVDIDEEKRIASVTVPERMLSLAIGREGQNARLAARLTGWRIDIRSDVSVAEAKAATDQLEGEAETPAKAEEAPAQAAAAQTEEAIAAPAKPKRTTKKAAAAAEAGDATPEASADGTEAATKPKRTTKKSAAVAVVADATAEASADGTEAAAKPKRTTKKAAADKADDQGASDGTAEAANAPEAAPTEEVAT